MMILDSLLNFESSSVQDQTLSSKHGVESGVEVSGIAEEFTEVLPDSVREVLNLGNGVSNFWDSIHENLSEIICNGGNLEDLLEDGLNHVRELALLGVVAESEIAVNSLVEIAPVTDEEEHLLY